MRAACLSSDPSCNSIFNYAAGVNPPVHPDPRNASTAGAFVRDTQYVDDRILANAPAGAPTPLPSHRGGDGTRLQWPVEPHRYRLIAARACPWAHRSLIVRRLMGLEPVISLGLTGPTHDIRSWTFDLDPDGLDPVLGVPRLKDAYEARFPGYPRGITVPAYVEEATGKVVTNDVWTVTIDLATQWGAYAREGAPDLRPAAHVDEMDELNDWLFHRVNNGVYKAGFAADQVSYESAYRELWDALDVVEERLSSRRYLVGDTITETDVRLFTTLVRFDAVCHGHFKCNRNRITEMPALWGYLRDLYQTPGFGDTTDLAEIKRHYYVVQSDVNPTKVVPLGPDMRGLLTPHGREALGGRPFGDGSAPGPVATGEEVRHPLR